MEGGFVKSSLLLFLDNREREMEGTTERTEMEGTTERRDLESITRISGDVTQLLAAMLEVCVQQ